MKRFVEWSLFVVIVGSVLAFGGVQPLSYSLMEIAIFLLLLLLLLRQAINIPLPLGFLPFIVWVILQLMPLPSHIVAWLSPARVQAPLASNPAVGPPGMVSLSIYPHQTALSLCKLLAYGGAFTLAAWVFDPQKRKSNLVRGLIWLGCFEAAYGIFQYLTGIQKIFTYTKQFYTEEGTGTYINHNHFAGFLELVIPLVVAQIFYGIQLRGGPDAPGGGRRSSRLPSWGGQVVFYAFLVIAMLVGIVFSRSRMGILSSLMSLVLISLVGRLRVNHRAWTIFPLFILGITMGYALWIGLDPVIGRYELLTTKNYLEREGRLPIWRDEINLMKDYPVFGSGLGTFALAFRRYQNVFLENLVDQAHNDYLQFSSEAGLPGALLFFGPIFFVWGKMILAFRRETGRYRRAVLLGCIGSAAALLIHSVTDFNLQIPANALVFSVILGIGYKAAQGEAPKVGAI